MEMFELIVGGLGTLVSLLTWDGWRRQVRYKEAKCAQDGQNQDLIDRMDALQKTVEEETRKAKQMRQSVKQETAQLVPKILGSRRS